MPSAEATLTTYATEPKPGERQMTPDVSTS
jgi:hypothetical protein